MRARGVVDDAAVGAQNAVMPVAKDAERDPPPNCYLRHVDEGRMRLKEAR